MNCWPDDTIDALLRDVARTISDNSRFLGALSDENTEFDESDEQEPVLEPDEDFEEL